MKTSPLLATFASRITAGSSRPLRATRSKSSQESTSAVDRRPTCLTHLFAYYYADWTVTYSLARTSTFSLYGHKCTNFSFFRIIKILEFVAKLQNFLKIFPVLH